MITSLWLAAVHQLIRTLRWATIRRSTVAPSAPTIPDCRNLKWLSAQYARLGCSQINWRATTVLTLVSEGHYSIWTFTGVFIPFLIPSLRHSSNLVGWRAIHYTTCSFKIGWSGRTWTYINEFRLSVQSGACYPRLHHRPIKLADPQGFEPQQKRPKRFVLPLHQGSIKELPQ